MHQQTEKNSKKPIKHLFQPREKKCVFCLFVFISLLSHKPGCYSFRKTVWLWLNKLVTGHVRAWVLARRVLMFH